LLFLIIRPINYDAYYDLFHESFRRDEVNQISSMSWVISIALNDES